jgi:prepilin-type N-terminal cleavage/methylation domain-containing protein
MRYPAGSSIRKFDIRHSHLIFQKKSGFTLIEMVAVMALVSLMAGIAIPAMQRWFDSISNRAQLSEVSIQFQRLASRAALLSQTVVLNKDSWRAKLSDGEVMLALPEGWSVISTAPVTFFYSGVCTGGYVDLLGPQQRKVQLQIAPVSCDVSIVR